MERHENDGASRPAYARMRRRWLLSRLRLAIALGLVTLPLGAIWNLFFATDRLRDRLLGFGFLTAAYVAMFVLTRRPRAARHASGLAVAFMLVLAAGLLYLLAQSPAEQRRPWLDLHHTPLARRGRSSAVGRVTGARLRCSRLACCASCPSPSASS